MFFLDNVEGKHIEPYVPVKSLGELTWYGGYHYTREREMDILTIYSKAFANELVKTFCVTSKQSVPLRVGVKLEEFDEDEGVANWPFRELVGSLMWLSTSARTMSTGVGGRSYAARHELLEMMPNKDRAAPLVWACSELPCTLRGSAPLCRRVGTCAAGAKATDLLRDADISAGVTLHSDTAVEEVV